MPKTLKEVTEEALLLGSDDRLTLIRLLLEHDNLYQSDQIDEPPPLSPAWEAEIAARIKEMDSGKMKMYSYEEIKEIFGL